MFGSKYLLQLGLLASLVSGCSTTPTPPTGSASTNPASNSASGASSGASTAPKPPSAANSPAQVHPGSGSGPQASADRRTAMQRFGAELASSRNLSASSVMKLLDESRYNPTVARIVTPAAPGQPRVPRSWATYRGRVVEPIRVAQGQAFMKQYAAELDRASARYGVEQHIIAAIIGVETLYGKSQGTFRVLDSLATLGFDYPDPTRPDRAEMFRGQLADLIELDLTGKLDARSLKGSYAGAVGIPQFMPGSIKRFAVSASGAKEINLSTNMADAISSVANFLVEHGWQRGLPVFVPVKLPAGAEKLVDGGLKPTLDWPQLQAAGARFSGSQPQTRWTRIPLGVIDLPEESAGTTELRTATQNFFTITQYNRSYFYAASVADLAAALATN